MNQSKSKLSFNATWSMAVGGMVGGGIFSTLGVVVGIAGWGLTQWDPLMLSPQGIMRLDCIDITIVRDTGMMQMQNKMSELEMKSDATEGLTQINWISALTAECNLFISKILLRISCFL